MRENNPILSIIIVSYNTKEITLKCIKSILADKQLKISGISQKAHPEDHTFETEIIVIDNASQDGSAEMLAKQPVKLTVNNKNAGFGKANNQGISMARGEYILLLNSDTIIHESAISQCLIWLSSHPESASCTPCLLNTDGTIQATGGYFPTIWNILTWTLQLDDLPFINSLIPPLHPHAPDFYTHDKTYTKDIHLDWLMGAFVLTRKNILTKINGFDENIFMYGEDIDLFYRINQKFPNLTNMFLHTPKITHIGGASSPTSSRRIFLEYQGLLTFFYKHRKKQFAIAKLIISQNAFIRKLAYTLMGKKSMAKLYTSENNLT